MDADYFTRREHEEFAKRVEVEHKRLNDENTRQNKRIDRMEDTMRKIEGLTISIEKMAVSIDTMTTELKNQGARLTAIENKPAKRWENLLTDILRVVVAAAVGFLCARIGVQ